MTPDFGKIPVFKPVIGGVRHLTWDARRPPDGIIVDLWCGGAYLVGSQRKSRPVDDCRACAEVYLEQTQAVPVPQRDGPHAPAGVAGRAWPAPAGAEGRL